MAISRQADSISLPSRVRPRGTWCTAPWNTSTTMQSSGLTAGAKPPRFAPVFDHSGWLAEGA